MRASTPGHCHIGKVRDKQMLLCRSCHQRATSLTYPTSSLQQIGHVPKICEVCSRCASTRSCRSKTLQRLALCHCAPSPTTSLCSPHTRIAFADWPEQHHKRRTKPSLPGSGTLSGAAAWELTLPHMLGHPMQPGPAHTCSSPDAFVNICIMGVALETR